MYKHYELWLDESGDFYREADKKEKNKSCSLVGGVLVSKEKVELIRKELIVPTVYSHANELTKEDKQNRILPTLERLQKDYGVREVFFENAKYEEGTGDNKSRSLYLRIISEGILQLLQTLNARHEDVRLDVLIARRITGPNEDNKIPIEPGEYTEWLSRYILKKKRDHKMVLTHETKVSFEIIMAAKDMRLQLADFACNTRLTRTSEAFNSDSIRPRVEALHKEALIISMEETDTVNYIKQCLTEINFSEAIVELMTTPDEIDFHEVVGIILDRLKVTSYRIVKSQMKTMSSRLIAHAERQDRYEDEEQFLKKIIRKLIPELENGGINCDHLKYNALLMLSDMYLIEGDIVHARESIDELGKVQEELGDCLEELFTLFQLREKQANLAIDEFDYEKAINIMREAENVFEHIMEYVCASSAASGRFPRQASEYYGDALCMELYAIMQWQRHNPGLYEEACRISDKAMEQYPNIEGELERHCQYRSHIEAEAGNFEKALKYLALARDYDLAGTDVESIEKFLRDIAINEVESSIQYYVMYYLCVMSRAKKQSDPLADRMFKAITDEKNLFYTIGIKDNRDRGFTKTVDVSHVLNSNDQRLYHPLEIDNWKLGSYHMMCGDYQKALRYIVEATSLSFKHKEYTRICIIGLCIMADLLICVMKAGSAAQFKMHARTIRENMDRILGEELSDSTRAFVEKVRAAYIEAGVNLDDIDRIRYEMIDREKLGEISGMTGY